MTVSRCDFVPFDEVEGFVFTVDVVRFYGTPPQDPQGNCKDGDEERAVEASEEIVGGEDVVAKGNGNRAGTGTDFGAVDVGPFEGGRAEWRRLFGGAERCGCEGTGVV